MNLGICLHFIRCVKINALHGNIYLGNDLSGHTLHSVFYTSLNCHTDCLQVDTVFHANPDLYFYIIVL